MKRKKKVGAGKKDPHRLALSRNGQQSRAQNGGGNATRMKPRDTEGGEGRKRSDPSSGH